MFVVGWWPSSDSLRELDRGRPHHDRQPQFHGRAGRVLLEYVSVFVKAEWSRASIPPRDLRPISSLYRNSKHGPRLTWALTLIHEGSILDITTDSCLSMSKGGHYEYQKQNNGGIDSSMLALSPLGMASAHETTVSVADDAAATTVEPRYGEKTTMTLISTAKKTGVTGYCLQPPSAAHYYQARITKNYTIKHYRVDYYEYGVKKRTFYQDMYEQVSEDPYLVCVS